MKAKHSVNVTVESWSFLILVEQKKIKKSFKNITNVKMGDAISKLALSIEPYTKKYVKQ